MDWGLILTNALRAAVGLDTVDLRAGRHRPERALRLHRPAQLRAGRLPRRRRLRPGDLASRRTTCRPCRASLVGLAGAVVLALLLGVPGAAAARRLPGDRHAGGRRDRPAVVRPVSLREYTNGSDGLSTSRSGFYSLNPLSQGRYGIGRVSFDERQTWVLIVGWTLVALVLPAGLPAHAQPVGPRAQGHPRGRGRRAQPRQERLLLQAAEPGPRRRARLPRRVHDRLGQRRRAAGHVRHRDHHLRADDRHPRRRRPGARARWSARSSSGAARRSPTTSSTRPATRATSRTAILSTTQVGVVRVHAGGAGTRWPSRSSDRRACSATAGRSRSMPADPDPTAAARSRR